MRGKPTHVLKKQKTWLFLRRIDEPLNFEEQCTPSIGKAFLLSCVRKRLARKASQKNIVFGKRLDIFYIPTGNFPKVQIV